MSAISRRQFGKVVIAGVPVATALRSFNLTAAGQSLLGVSTLSFRGFPRTQGQNNVDDVLRALKETRAAHIEFALTHVEPAPPNMAPFIGGSAAYPVRIVPTPAQIAATNVGYRAELREWRRRTPQGYFEEMRGKILADGRVVHGIAVTFDDALTDADIDATLNEARALGATTVSSPLTMAMATRLAPFADKHKITIAIHNQVDGNAEKQIATPELEQALSLSPAFSLKLDIGNLTAANGDAVAVLKKHQARVSYVAVKDRLRNGGASQHLGEGDTPIAGVLNLLKASEKPIPALVEYDYVGLRSPVEEVAASLAVLTKTLK